MTEPRITTSPAVPCPPCPSPGEGREMIAATGLVKEFDKLRVLDGATLSVKCGEVAVMLGPSGGGKSTLLRCLNGLEAFQAGEVRVGDLTLTAAEPGPSTLLALRRRLGMVFQQFNLFPHMTALENVL